MSSSDNNNIITSCAQEPYCENDDSYHNNNNDGLHNKYYCIRNIPQQQCHSLAAQLLACSTTDADRQSQTKQLPMCLLDAMLEYDKHTHKTLEQVWHIQCTIVVTVVAITLARVLVYQSSSSSSSTLVTGWNFKNNLYFRYLIEFFVISLPAVLSVNIINSYVELIVFGAFAVLILLIWRTKCWQKASKRDFKFGRRPSLFTLIRSTISILTVLCILAIDFESFPKTFRKSRRYGAGLMDVGIGLFVFSMGIVSTRPRRFSDLRKLIFTVGCMLVLGLARTLVIAAIDYHQDEHEYGVHLNAFFTLGFTKLFATLLGFIARSDKHLLPLGVVILALHETILQLGVWKYVMNPKLERTDFMTANREGLCSLPGFIALYILSQYLGQWMQAKDVLNFAEIKQKFKTLTLTSLSLWCIVVISIYAIGIARVTCNFGYVIWILAIALTVCTLYLFVFDIILDTLKPVNTDSFVTINATELGGNASSKVLDNVNTKIPVLIEAVNYNGLTFFLLANVLTGSINIFLKTDEKSSVQSVVILLNYMLITTGVVFVLYRYKIRIA